MTETKIIISSSLDEKSRAMLVTCDARSGTIDEQHPVSYRDLDGWALEECPAIVEIHGDLRTPLESGLVQLLSHVMRVRFVHSSDRFIYNVSEHLTSVRSIHLLGCSLPSTWNCKSPGKAILDVRMCTSDPNPLDNLAVSSLTIKHVTDTALLANLISRCKKLHIDMNGQKLYRMDIVDYLESCNASRVYLTSASILWRELDKILCSGIQDIVIADSYLTSNSPISLSSSYPSVVSLDLDLVNLNVKSLSSILRRTDRLASLTLPEVSFAPSISRVLLHHNDIHNLNISRCKRIVSANHAIVPQIRNLMIRSDQAHHRPLLVSLFPNAELLEIA